MRNVVKVTKNADGINDSVAHHIQNTWGRILIQKVWDHTKCMESDASYTQNAWGPYKMDVWAPYEICDTFY